MQHVYLELLDMRCLVNTPSFNWHWRYR